MSGIKSEFQENTAERTKLGAYYFDFACKIFDDAGLPDKEEGNALLNKAAQFGNADANLMLADRYERASGVDRNPVKALGYYTKYMLASESFERRRDTIFDLIEECRDISDKKGIDIYIMDVVNAAKFAYDGENKSGFQNTRIPAEKTLDDVILGIGQRR